MSSDNSSNFNWGACWLVGFPLFWLGNVIGDWVQDQSLSGVLLGRR
jgi:hypothetical protein